MSEPTWSRPNRVSRMMYPAAFSGFAAVLRHYQTATYDWCI
ncbi:hypothetical protein [Kibdelosporangium aridum]